MQSNEQTEKRAEALSLLGQLVDTRTNTDRAFRRAVGTLPEDLQYIGGTLGQNPQSWRLNRAFHTVHVPSLIAAITLLGEIDRMETVGKDEVDEILAALSRAASLARDARKRLEAAKLTEAKIEIGVLADYAKPPAIPYCKPSMLTRAFDSVATASEAAWDNAKSGASSVGAFAGALQSGVNDAAIRAASVPTLASNLQKSVTGALSDNISRPLSMRLGAGGRALESGIGAGVGLGVVVGILCPPLLPITAGGAVLAAMRTWRKDMDKARTLNAEERDQRIAQLSQERAAALKQLTHGSGALQMETDDLSLTLDAETGEADAVLLNGEHEGRTWSSLSVEEKAETAATLTGAAVELIKIIRLATED